MHPIKQAWRAGFTRRWHQNADMCETQDPTAGHSGRMAMLALAFWPDADRDLLAAITLHDAGEQGFADMSGDFKNEFPEFAKICGDHETRNLAAMGLRMPELTAWNAAALKFLDKLDAYLWVAHHKPHLCNRADWRIEFLNLQNIGSVIGINSERLDQVVAGR